ncbi:winged helix-turn-helix domain-containing protein [Halorutilales archaeon Cl-col2-1]
MEIYPEFKLWFTDDDGDYVFGEGTMALLQEIDETGTVSEAAENTEMSYRYALDKIQTVEERLGTTLVERKRGGSEGGGASLTDDGKTMLREYDEVRRSIDDCVGSIQI